MSQQDLLFGISNELFQRMVLSATGILFAAAVHYLRNIARDVTDLKKTAGVMIERSESHGKRLDRLENVVFSGSMAS